jgi:hypothetical protein
MADIPDHQRRTLEDYKQRLSLKMGEVARILMVINSIEEEHGLPKTALDSLGPGISWSLALGEQVRMTDSNTSGLPTRSNSIRPDEYLGERPLEAAKKYLKRIRQAAHIDQIAEAISKGGAAIKGSDWKGALEESLLRSTLEVVKVSDHTFGLVEFYSEAQLENLRAVRRRPLPGESKRRRGRPPKKDRLRAIAKALRKARESSGGSAKPEPPE